MRSQRTRCVGLLMAVAAILALAVPARADTVVDWNVHATNMLIVTAGQSPPVSTLHLAMVHGAVYDAVNAIDRRYQPYLASPPARRWYSKDAAAATAAHHVLVGLQPTQQTALDALYAESLAGIPSGHAKEGGIAVGAAAAQAMLAARADDGRFGPFRFTPGTEPGQWRPTLPMMVNDPNAWVAQVRPFLIESASQFRTRGPRALESRKYAREFNEVKSLGSLDSATRTMDQTDMARFWAEGPAIFTRVTRDLAAAHPVEDNARLFAMLYLTGADALIGCWDDKAYWSWWRPITAIREADGDGNPATEADPDWLPLIDTPPYPEHPAGLACVSSAMAKTLSDFFGTDRAEFSATGANSGTTRSFTRFSQTIEEVIDARVYSGIHFRSADVQGARLGEQVARYRDKHYFRPVRCR